MARYTMHDLRFPFWLDAAHFINVLHVLIDQERDTNPCRSPNLYWNDDAAGERVAAQDLRIGRAPSQSVSRRFVSMSETGSELTKHNCMAQWGGVPMYAVLNLCRPLPRVRLSRFMSICRRSTHRFSGAYGEILSAVGQYVESITGRDGDGREGPSIACKYIGVAKGQCTWKTMHRLLILTRRRWSVH
jgi:hypothetical protein